jgi:hypothetical protein
VNAERTKLIRFEGVFLRKCLPFDGFSAMNNEKDWEKAVVLIHQCRLECRVHENVESVQINPDFILISQSSSTTEVVVALMAEKKIWKLQTSSLRDFLDLSTFLIHSKVPTWSMSPVCQGCSKDFSLGVRKHHCRNCGKVTCSQCTVKPRFTFEGFSRMKKVCNSCLLLINSQISIIRELNRNLMFDDFSNKSVLGRNSRS